MTTTSRRAGQDGARAKSKPKNATVIDAVHRHKVALAALGSIDKKHSAADERNIGNPKSSAAQRHWRKMDQLFRRADSRELRALTALMRARPGNAMTVSVLLNYLLRYQEEKPDWLDYPGVAEAMPVLLRNLAVTVTRIDKAMSA